MDGRGSGVILIGLGVMIVVIGVLVQAGWLSWFGHLPGDIRIESERTRFYLPITSMVIVSIVLTLVVNLLRRW